MQVKSIADCSKGSILQYFLPEIKHHFPLQPLFCLLLSGHLRQVLLYSIGLKRFLEVTFMMTYIANQNKIPQNVAFHTGLH